MRSLLIIGLLLILTNCDNIGEQKPPSSSQTSNLTEIDSIDKNADNTKTIKTIFPSPIDINKILQLNILGTTSSFLSKSEIKTRAFCKPKEMGLFGHYQLFHKKKREQWSYMGELTVFTTEQAKNWRQDSRNQSFIEIQLSNPDIAIWDSIRVGTKENNLIKFIGNNFHYKKGTIIYCELGDYSASFTILADTVNKLAVGKYCKDKN